MIKSTFPSFKAKKKHQVLISKWWTGLCFLFKLQSAIVIARNAATPEQFDKDAAYFPGIHAGHQQEGAPTTKYFNGDQAGASIA